MALDIHALRAALKTKSEEGGSGENTGFWDKFYPFYKMDFDQTTIFRFLPDADEENPIGFIMENKYHELTINGKKKRIACLKMYGESCPCCELSQKHYNDGDTQMGKTFWRKIDYIAQGLIVHSAFEYEVKPDDNPVRLISIGPKLYKLIEAKIVNGDMDEMPYDMINGYDFRITKSRQGEYADYSTSDFARKSSQISAAAIDKLELYDLKKYRYAKIEREQMEAMIEAFLTGKSYDEKSGDASKPSESTGSASLDSSVSSPKPTQEAASVVAAATSTPADSTATPTKKLSPQEILAKVKARQQAGA